MRNWHFPDLVSARRPCWKIMRSWHLEVEMLMGFRCEMRIKILSGCCKGKGKLLRGSWPICWPKIAWKIGQICKNWPEMSLGQNCPKNGKIKAKFDQKVYWPKTSRKNWLKKTKIDQKLGWAQRSQKREAKLRVEKIEICIFDTKLCFVLFASLRN